MPESVKDDLVLVDGKSRISRGIVKRLEVIATAGQFRYYCVFARASKLALQVIGQDISAMSKSDIADDQQRVLVTPQNHQFVL